MNSLSNRIKLARDFLGRSSHCTGLPLEFSIELTNRCNLKCAICPRQDRTPRGLGEMELATFARIIEQSRDTLEFAYLHLAGEPLLHPRLGECIAHAAAQGVTTGLSTNGTLLGREAAEMLIASPLASLIISLDGTEAETYRKIRGGDHFDRVVANVQQFLKLKKAAGRGPQTIIQMICLDENRHQARQFLRDWQQRGADAVRLKRFFNFAGNVAEQDTQTNAPAPPQTDGASQGRVPRPPCFLLWRQLAFYYTGEAVSCCHDFLHQSLLGNINQQSLAALWNTPRIREMRALHLAGRQEEIPLCARCNQPELGWLQVLGLTALNAPAAKKLLITGERLARLAGIKKLY